MMPYPPDLVLLAAAVQPPAADTPCDRDLNGFVSREMFDGDLLDDMGFAGAQQQAAGPK